MSLLILMTGVLVTAVGLMGSRVNAIRKVESLIPDHDES
jgi:hypothetical protein